MLKTLYIRKYKKEKIVRNKKNTIILPLLINFNNNKTPIYTYFKYIKSNKLTLYNLTKNIYYKDSYNIYKKKGNIFNLNNNYYSNIYIQDNLNHKTISIKYNFINLNYLFSKNILLPKNIISQTLHKQFNTNFILYFLNNKYLTNSQTLKFGCFL